MQTSFTILIFIIASTTALAQEAMLISRINSPIKIDGMPNEEAWNKIEPLPLTMYTPVFKGKITERTEIRIGYDDYFIYASGKFYDSEPDKIQGNSMIRDVDNGGDFFNLMIDTYDDNETFDGFGITPTGNRTDVEISNDAEGDENLFYNLNWNTYWEGEAKQTEEGWFAEIRIPFTSLKFEEKNGEVRFGITVHRLIGRKNERYVFPAIPPNWTWGPWKASQAQTIIMRGVKKRNPLYITPYLLGGYQLSYEMYPDVMTRKEKFKKEAGVDIKWGISNNANLDLTINTDFAQIEADDEQINLTRFSLFFPEKRQFFQERGGAFSFSTGGNDRLFYSRRIGISDNNTLLRMYGGIRLTARSKGWEIGVMDAQTGGKDTIPTENFGVIRLKKRVFNKNSFIGSMLTSRIDGKGRTRLAYGLDGVFNLYKSNFLTLKGGQSYQTGNDYDFWDLSFGYLLLENRNITGFGYQLEINNYGKNYIPYMGFIARPGEFSAKESVRYGFLIKPTAIRLVTPFVYHASYYDNIGFEKKTEVTELGISFGAKTGAFFSLTASRNVDLLKSPFYLADDVVINPGKYTYDLASGRYMMNANRRFQLGWEADAGKFYNGNRISITISPVWSVSKYLYIGVDALYNYIKFPQDTTYRGNILRLKTTIALNTRLSLNGFLQFNQDTKTTGINMRLRYNWRDGNDLYVVFNQGTHDKDLEIPHLESRSILLKYTYTLVKK